MRQLSLFASFRRGLVDGGDWRLIKGARLGPQLHSPLTTLP